MTHKLVLLLTIALLAGSAFAHGDEQHVMGTVTKVSQSSVTVQTSAKTTVDVTITPDTKFTKNNASATPNDMQVGDRVVIHAMTMKGGMLMADTVQIGVSKTPAKSH
jgi:ribosomal protein S1